MSVQNIGRNKWRVIVKTSERTESGKPRYHDKVFSGTKSEAQAFERKLAGYRVAGKQSMTLHEFAKDVWLPSLQIQPSTARNYRIAVEKLTALHDIELASISPRDIESAIHSLPKGNQRRMARTALSVALNAAVRWSFLEFSPLSKAQVTIGEGAKRRYNPYSIEELGEMLTALRGDPCEASVIVMSYGGLCKEEALALDWGDINFGTGAITVSKAWVSDDGELRLKGTKNTHRERIVYVTGSGLERLRELSADKSGPIWPGRDRGRIRPDAATRHFRKSVERAGLRYIPINTLRHTHATLALEGGIDVAVISRGLGHSRISTTVDRYVRPLEAARMSAAAAFAAAIEAGA